MSPKVWPSGPVSEALQYSSASMMVSTRSVTAGSAGFGEWWVSMEQNNRS